jgi:hypothetical protein
MRCGWMRWRRWCWTRPTGCSTWASRPSANGCWPLPAQRQNLLFSATFPPEVQALADALLHDAVRVEAASQAAAEPVIVQRVIAVDAARRTELLRHLATEGQWRGALVFVATRHAADQVARKLHDRGLFAAPLHGDMSQSQRTERLALLKDGGFDLLVTTDLAARGIDIPGPAGGRQLRPAPLAQRLRAPHRPHRPRRRQRHGHQLRQRGDRGALPADREAAGPGAAARDDRRLRTGGGGGPGAGRAAAASRASARARRTSCGPRRPAPSPAPARAEPQDCCAAGGR